jgi:DNA-directed RNA polymerase subunit RPC12/RpoP
MTDMMVNLDLPTDEAGMLPRQCPNCDRQFAIHEETYTQEQYLNLRCPYCEWIGEFDEFLTEEQAAYGEAVAETEARQMLEEEFAEMFEDAFSGVGSSDFIEVETNMDEIDFGHPNTPSPHLTIETDQISCNYCDFQFAVIDETEDTSCPVCR